MEERIERLSDHYIVCAYGRVGRSVARELAVAAIHQAHELDRTGAAEVDQRVQGDDKGTEEKVAASRPTALTSA